MVEKYKNHTTKELKKALKHLKSTNSDLTEIKYVARPVRNTLRNVNNNLTGSTHNHSFNHDDYIQRNFWGYVKNVIKVKDQMLLTFSMSECLSYFTNILANFRPITLETIPLKVFTSCLRNSIFTFLLANNFIEHNIQKGFAPHVSGTLEHTTQMAYIINQARIKQRSLVITLLDLKNAFGEINHNLIHSVLGYHHIPDHIKILIKSLYTNFKTSIIMSSFNTPFIIVGRGVLQGDCLSPLLFNLCFNTFIQHIKSDQYCQFGFSHKLLNLIHWFQFADDASVITSLETENQHLLNRFS